MAPKRHTTEEIVRKLRAADVALGEGKTMVQVCKQLGVTEQTYYRWRKQYGSMKLGDAKRLKELEQENAKLKKIIAEQALDKEALKELLKKNGKPTESTQICHLAPEEAPLFRAPSLRLVEFLALDASIQRHGLG